MMVTIQKGELRLTIPSGAYGLYASMGWEQADNSATHTNPKVTASKSVVAENAQPQDDPKTDDVVEPDEEEYEEEIVEVDPEELLHRPLGELDFEELQIAAEYLGLDTNDLTTSKKLRAVIKAAQN